MIQTKIDLKFFNLTEYKDFDKFVAQFKGIFELMPDYEKCVTSVGVFFGSKQEDETYIKAFKFTKDPDFPIFKPNKSLYNYLMRTYSHENIQAIIVFVEDYLTSTALNIKWTILHEMAHVICGHLKDDNITYPVSFKKLPADIVNYLVPFLANAQRDYETDCFLAEKFPDLALEHEFEYSQIGSQNDPKKLKEKVPSWRYRFEITVILIEYYRNLLILKHLPTQYQHKNHFKKAQRNFEIKFKTARIYLSEQIKKDLPPAKELIIEIDFKHYVTLMQWFCRITELDTKTPIRE